MDDFDRAQELEQRQRDQALAIQADLARASSLSSYSHCEDCGDAIPAPRRQAVPGCTRCIDCQQRQEGKR
ncbi:Conjugal transfer protein TraR [Chromobacterium violaceum]|uniref:Conjugal transfer protein TraR n=1 Tax=Chromobacterium sphagni TaxID=1903179 RepID=A0ABX3CFX4_9NEIS|nr:MULTISPECIES: TraR/DksA family transcriptional regulator [Chromobacterium]MBX9268766.1 TraR/DksA family transcriptional regulator [Chromobacterium violaceum]OHX21228.1 conjugal transfer protein TraR [Chromobacterium sphagni]